MPAKIAKPQPYSEHDVLTISQMAKRLKMRAQDAYIMAETPGFPLYNLGGERKNRVIWGEVLQWIRENKSAS